MYRVGLWSYRASETLLFLVRCALRTLRNGSVLLRHLRKLLS